MNLFLSPSPSGSRMALALELAILALGAVALLYLWAALSRNWDMEQARLSAQVRADHAALCEKFGRTRDTPAFSACLDDLTALKDRHERMFADQTLGLP